MKPELLTRALLTWGDVADAVTRLPKEQQDLAAEIVAAERPSIVDSVSIGDGPWHVVSAVVSGHMGIGEQALTIDFTAGPGLTIVTARNGTGKTSYVDGVRGAISNGRKREFEAVEQNLHHEEALRLHVWVRCGRGARFGSRRRAGGPER